jgi:sortase A
VIAAPATAALLGLGLVLAGAIGQPAADQGAAHAAPATATSVPTVTPRSALPPAAWVRIPAIGVSRRLVWHAGRPDDAAGTRLQNKGLLAGPLGRTGGSLPGVPGNLVITGHRTSAGRPLWRLPALRRGAEVAVTFRGHVYVYRITGGAFVDASRRGTIARLVAPVPWHPGAKPKAAVLTMISCATPEDNAAGDRYRDAQHNPRHRIVRYGVLVRVVPPLVPPKPPTPAPSPTPTPTPTPVPSASGTAATG